MATRKKSGATARTVKKKKAPVLAQKAVKKKRLVIGKAKGGVARAEALSPERRQSIAKKAAAARWGAKPLRATHRGNFEKEFGIDVECYVLGDEQKTAVVSQRGLAATLGLPANRGTNLVRFLKSAKVAAYMGAELTEKLDNPLLFQWSSANTTVYGYDVTLLIDICKAVIRAADDGVLLQSLAIAKQSHVIVRASAKAGIKGLVYALAGYDATAAEVIEAFKVYVREEAREYENEFPSQLYQEWYRLYALPKPRKNKPWKFKHLTVGQVYIPLAHSNGKILSLTRAQRAASRDRHAKLHQFLSEIGVKALRTHLGQLLGIAQLSDNKDKYEKNVEKVFGRQTSFDFGDG